MRTKELFGAITIAVKLQGVHAFDQPSLYKVSRMNGLSDEQLIYLEKENFSETIIQWVNQYEDETKC